MANPELGPNTSYSDPLYDRLEGFFRNVAARWGLVILAIVAVLIVLVIVKFRREHSAAAESYALCQDVGRDTEKKPALLDNPKVTDLDKSKIASELASRAMREKKPQDAEKYSKQGLEFAKKAGNARMTALHRLNLAAIAANAGEVSKALELYQQVEKAKDAKTEAAMGQLGSIVTGLAVAAECKDPAKMLQHRQEAYDSLKDLRDLRDPGTEPLVDLANYLIADLVRQHPEVLGSDAKAPVSATTTR